MIVTMLGVTWKIRSWKTGKVPFRPLFVYKSQGQGGLADLIPSENLTCFEVSKLRCEVLKAKGYNVTQCDFLKVQPEAKYDRVVMNPPFSEGRWQAHTIHAASMVKAGGRLVAILPSGAKNKLKLD